MADINCPFHGFNHLSSKNSTIANVKVNYDNNILSKVNIEGVIRYCRLMSQVITNTKISNYALEMNEECPDGFNKANNATFTCDKRRGVLVGKVAMCALLNIAHASLKVFSYKMVDVESICCINKIDKLTLFPKIVIGGKCNLKSMPFKNYVGICKWMGRINDIECIGLDTTHWISNECNGYIHGVKLFDCRSGHGILAKSDEIEMVDINDDEQQQSGFVELKNVFYAMKTKNMSKDLLNYGRRVKSTVLLHEKYGTFSIKAIHGVIKWMGQINKQKCFGIELDYPCEGAMDGIISHSESFDCEPGHGAVYPINSVTFDYYVHSAEFTVDETFDINLPSFNKEDWNHKIIHERDLRMNTKTFVYIKQDDIILDVKGVLKWFGYIQKFAVGILEMDANFPITTQQKVTQILKDPKPLSHIIVNAKYLFKYRTLKSYEKFKDYTENFDCGEKTKFGTVKWRGVDENGCLYYGFETESSSDSGGNGTFKGQQLFQCEDGRGVLISAEKVHVSLYSKIARPKAENNTDEHTMKIEDVVTLLTTVADNHGISSEDLISAALKIKNKNVLVPLLNNLSPSVNIYKNPEMVNQLLESQSFDTLQISLGKCDSDADNNKQLLRVAAESLKYGKTKLFEGCMNKCSNKDALMDNGETFITHIIKEKFDQSLIIQTIEDYEFDITKANKDNCIPLTLACTNMMMDVVDCIVRYIKNQDIGKKVCSICMDRNIKTVFNCGHNSCKQCSDSITNCHICKETIITRRILYLN